MWRSVLGLGLVVSIGCGGDDGKGPAAVDAALRNEGVGDDCAKDACRDGLSCEVLSSCFGDDCAKVCVRHTESCVDDPCGPDALCIANVGEPGGVCEPRQALGQPCDGPPGGDPSLNYCTDGSFCAFDGEKANTCVPALEPGEQCPTLFFGSQRQACTEGHTCRRNLDTQLDAQSYCLPLREEGDECVNATDCAEGLACTGMCSKAPEQAARRQ